MKVTKMEKNEMQNKVHEKMIQ